VEPSRSQTTLGDALLRSRPLAAQCSTRDTPSETTVSTGCTINRGADILSSSPEIIQSKTTHANRTSNTRYLNRNIWAVLVAQAVVGSIPGQDVSSQLGHLSLSSLWGR